MILKFFYLQKEGTIIDDRVITISTSVTHR